MTANTRERIIHALLFVVLISLVLGVILALLGVLSLVHNMGGFLGELPFMAIGIPAITSFYFDWFGGCIQAFIFCTLTTLFIKQAAGD